MFATNQKRLVFVCFAYILGLLSTSTFAFLPEPPHLSKLLLLVIIWLIITLISTFTLPRFWQLKLNKSTCCWAGCIAIFAMLYFAYRMPQPQNSYVNKIFSQIESSSNLIPVLVKGKVLSSPRTTSNYKSQFWLQIESLSITTDNNSTLQRENITDKLYVTAPLLQTTGISPQEKLSITGNLFQPQPPLNPGEFNFKNYLYRHNCFAQLQASKINFLSHKSSSKFNLWQLKEKIIQSQVKYLGSTKGLILSSIVLGRKAVDLPKNMQNIFIKAGLAHVLAASGFHVSLLLGFILLITQKFSLKQQFIIATITLIFYLGLTGLQPSILRASLMGLGALIGLLTKRQAISLNTLFLAIIILLLFNPLWIWDLGLQLSCLATFGLIIIAPYLTKKLDWLPEIISNLITIPIAASICTLPLIIYYFKVVVTYSILANIITSPLVIIISLGGMISAVFSLVYSPLGSAIAWSLAYPLELLLNILKFFTNLPGSQFSLGHISLFTVIILYSIITLLIVSAKSRKKIGFWLFFSLTLVTLPIWFNHLQEFKITILATGNQQNLVIQNHGNVTLFTDTNYDKKIQSKILPFLQQAGINQIDNLILANKANKSLSVWQNTSKRIKIKNIYVSEKTLVKQAISSNARILPIKLNQTLNLSDIKLSLVSSQPNIWQWQINNKLWLTINSPPNQSSPDKLIKQQFTNADNYIVWLSNFKSLPNWLNFLKGKELIISGNNLDTKIRRKLTKAKIKFYLTGEDGAIIWQPNQELTTYKNIFQNPYSL